MSTNDMKAKFDAIVAEMAALKSKLGVTAAADLAALEAKVHSAVAAFEADFAGEVEEFKTVGFFGWVKSNPKTAAVIAVLAAVVMAAVKHFMF